MLGAFRFDHFRPVAHIMSDATFRILGVAMEDLTPKHHLIDDKSHIIWQLRQESGLFLFTASLFRFDIRQDLQSLPDTVLG